MFVISLKNIAILLLKFIYMLDISTVLHILDALKTRTRVFITYDLALNCMCDMFYSNSFEKQSANQRSTGVFNNHLQTTLFFRIQ